MLCENQARSVLTRLFSIAAATAVLTAVPSVIEAQAYWPGQHLDWERKAPAVAGFDAGLLQAAVDFAMAAEPLVPLRYEPLNRA